MRYEFGPFELDVVNACLLREGKRVAIARQPMMLLEKLLERPGTLVNRDALAAALWPAGTRVDTERGLNAAIRKLRKALGDSANDPQYLETIPMYGYRFIGEVRRVEARSAKGSVGTGDRPARARRRGWGIVAASVAVIVAMVMLTTSNTARSVFAPAMAILTGQTCDGEVSVQIAVAPVKSTPDNQALDRLASALTSELIDELWEVETVRLVASPVSEATRDSGRGYRLESQLFADEEQLILRLTLLDAQTDRLVLQRSVEAPRYESYLLRGQVAEHMARVVTG